MSVTYKDIDQLSQKSAVAGTEKLPVSDTQYITPEQISGISGVSTGTGLGDLDILDENEECLVRFSGGHIKTKNFDSSNVPTESSVSGWGFVKYVLLADEAAYTALATKDSGTLYLIPKTS